MSFETRSCRECGGHGSARRCGNDAHDRPETITCGWCEGSGWVKVFVYETSRK